MFEPTSFKSSLTALMAFVNNLLQNATRYARYHHAAVTRYQAHSPFVFAFLENVLDDRRHYYAFDSIENLRSLMLRSGGYADVEDFGTGRSGRVWLRDLARRSASTQAKGQRLFRLVQWLQPQTIVELGTSTGIGTAYLAAANTRAAVWSVEGAAALTAIAKAHMELLELPNVHLISGRFETVLPDLPAKTGPIDLLYIDGNHRQEPTLRYLETCLPNLNPEGLMVFDDIHWSDDMENAWNTICADERVRLSIDCFDIGLVSFSKQFREKQHYTLIPLRHKPWKALF
jgi:predicted O-methyltransferase YrrM